MANSKLNSYESIPVTVARLIIKLYQATRILRPACCRFYPSCSDYSLAALQTYGFIRGVSLTLIRLLKCHPWHIGGIDLLPASAGPQMKIVIRAGEACKLKSNPEHSARMAYELCHSGLLLKPEAAPIS